ncbi:hypothetical protein EFK50_06060 [Nocardioides marmoriginsengisoli]|uniref:Uncharacterized protein n=1 Tax=Nocardioides marmoriginsengisoli TaxID=661483 RepID=A0A3N0CKX0_9ACTN|nr:hypothetical protein [Nocardioides marmoriginsengisoli]RNL64104.1 hypothetical protein EFK50_06060 [Nocardioides marmoriginsengisoli]
MSPRRVGAVLTAVVLLAGPTACGDQEADYCAALKKHQSIFSDDGTGESLVENLSALTEISDDAPDDLSDEWQVFLGALGELRDKITAAGVKPADIVGGVRPDSVSEADWAEIKAAANELASPTVADALTGIDQQAKDVCKLQLGL